MGAASVPSTVVPAAPQCADRVRGEVRSCCIFVFRESNHAARNLCNLVFAFAVPNAAPAPLHCVHHPLPGNRRRVRHFSSRRSPFRQSIVEKQLTSSSRDHASMGQGEESGSPSSATSGNRACRTHGCGCTDALCVSHAGVRGGDARSFCCVYITFLPAPARPASSARPRDKSKFSANRCKFRKRICVSHLLQLATYSCKTLHTSVITCRYMLFS